MRKERLIWAHGLGVQAVLARKVGQEREASGHAVSTARRKREECSHFPYLLFFLQSGTLVHRGVSPVLPQLSISENNLSDIPRNLSLGRF